MNSTGTALRFFGGVFDCVVVNFGSFEFWCFSHKKRRYRMSLFLLLFVRVSVFVCVCMCVCVVLNCLFTFFLVCCAGCVCVSEGSPNSTSPCSKTNSATTAPHRSTLPHTRPTDAQKPRLQCAATSLHCPRLSPPASSCSRVLHAPPLAASAQTYQSVSLRVPAVTALLPRSDARCARGRRGGGVGGAEKRRGSRMETRGRGCPGAVPRHGGPSSSKRPPETSMG